MVSKTLATTSKTATVGPFALEFLLTVEETSQKESCATYGSKPELHLTD